MDKKTRRVYKKKQARDRYCNWHNCIQSLPLEESPTYTKSSWVAYKDKAFDLKILSNRYQVRYMKISTFQLGLYYYAIFMLNTARKQESRPRSRNELGLPHPRRPRGSQSGREKRRDESFQVRAKEPLGTDSHRTISKNSSGCPAPDWAQKMLCTIVPNRRTHLLSSFRVFVHDGYCLDHGLSGSCTKEMHAVRKLSVWYKIPIWFQNTVCPKTKDAFPKIQAWAYNRYSRLHRSRVLRKY